MNTKQQVKNLDYFYKKHQKVTSGVIEDERAWNLKLLVDEIIEEYFESNWDDFELPKDYTKWVKATEQFLDEAWANVMMYIQDTGSNYIYWNIYRDKKNKIIHYYDLKSFLHYTPEGLLLGVADSTYKYFRSGGKRNEINSKGGLNDFKNEIFTFQEKMEHAWGDFTIDDKFHYFRGLGAAIINHFSLYSVYVFLGKKKSSQADPLGFFKEAEKNIKDDYHCHYSILGQTIKNFSSFITIEPNEVNIDKESKLLILKLEKLSNKYFDLSFKRIMKLTQYSDLNVPQYDNDFYVLDEAGDIEIDEKIDMFVALYVFCYGYKNFIKYIKKKTKDYRLLLAIIVKSKDHPDAPKIQKDVDILIQKTLRDYKSKKNLLEKKALISNINIILSQF